MATICGYARRSTTKQDLDLQKTELKAAGCRIIEDSATGTNTNRPGLKRLLKEVEEGDTVIVYKLDRVGRSGMDIINLLHDLTQRHVFVKSLHDGLDLTPKTDAFAEAVRKMTVHIVAIFAELDRDMIVARTSAGRAHAKANGVPFGRDPKLTPDQIAMARREIANNTSVAALARGFHVHPATLYRYLADDERAEKALKTLAVRETKRSRKR